MGDEDDPPDDTEKDTSTLSSLTKQIHKWYGLDDAGNITGRNWIEPEPEDPVEKLKRVREELVLLYDWRQKQAGWQRGEDVKRDRTYTYPNVYNVPLKKETKAAPTIQISDYITPPEEIRQPEYALA